MHIEVEIKIKVDNFNLLKKALMGNGKLIKSIRQVDEYYTPCQRNFFKQKNPTEWLRVRTNPDKTIFEYDKSINMQENGQQDYAQEYETEVKQPEELKKILKFLDFKKVITVDKKREYWDCGSFEVVLDEVKNLGSFVEVELVKNYKNASLGRQKCIDFLKKLNVQITENDIIKNGYPVLLMNARRRVDIAQ